MGCVGVEVFSELLGQQHFRSQSSAKGRVREMSGAEDCREIIPVFQLRAALRLTNAVCFV